MSLRIKSENLTFGGRQIVFTHDAASVSCSMTGAIFLPSRAMQEPVPVIYYLSGLTCTEQNVITKAGAQRYCQDHAVALVCPDTSRRRSRNRSWLLRQRHAPAVVEALPHVRLRDAGAASVH
jgi:S-formylglutathione hydrolase